MVLSALGCFLSKGDSHHKLCACHFPNVFLGRLKDFCEIVLAFSKVFYFQKTRKYGARVLRWGKYISHGFLRKSSYRDRRRPFISES